MPAPRILFSILLLVMGALAAGCAASSSPSAAGEDSARFVAKPAPPGGQDQYTIQPGDVLTIKFAYHPDHDVNDAVVRPDGKLVLPLVGEVKAAEQTPEKLSGALETLYAKNLRAPKIDVSVKTMNLNRVFVGGEVARPGFVDYRPGLTPLQAIINAGGVTEYGKMEEVVLLRRLNERGEYQATKLNLQNALEAGEKQHNPPLGPSDMVFVSQSTIGKMNIWVDQWLIKMNPFKGTFTLVPF